MKDSLENILLKSSNDHGILRLTLNDPDNKNALSELMMQELLKAIRKGKFQNKPYDLDLLPKGNELKK